MDTTTVNIKQEAPRKKSVSLSGVEAGQTAIPHSQVDVQFLGLRRVRLTVPLAALGSHFTPTEPWVGYRFTAGVTES